MIADRFIAAFEQLVESATGRYRYAAKYEYTVVSQSADGRCTLRPTATNPEAPALPAVPIKGSSPTQRIKVQPGAVCYVTYAGMNPDRPIIDGFDSSDSYISEEHGDNALGVVRQGDLVRFGGLGAMVSFSSAAGTPVFLNNGPVSIPGPYLISYGNLPPGTPPIPPTLVPPQQTPGYGMTYSASKVLRTK